MSLELNSLSTWGNATSTFTNIEAWFLLVQALSASKYGKNRDEFTKTTRELCDSESNADANTLLVAVPRYAVQRCLGICTILHMLIDMKDSKKHYQILITALNRVWSRLNVGSQRDGFAPEDPVWNAQRGSSWPKPLEAAVPICLGLSRIITQN